MNKEILQKAISKWGPETQINKIQEEALELSLVLNQRKCPTKDIIEMEAKLYDELADMKIMMAQAEMLFDVDRINARVDFKLNKLVEKFFKCGNCRCDLINSINGLCAQCWSEM